MNVLNDLLVGLNDLFWSFLVIPLLVVLALYFTVRSGFVQLRLLPEMFRVLRGSPGVAPDGGREISSFQAFAISAASRVGTGNIVGVSFAIILGGPGAVFWMWVMAGLLGAAAFVESTLAQLYKVRTATGFRGGPAYYMLYGLKRRWMGVLFAVLITVTFSLVFNSVHANSLAGAITTSVEAGGGSGGFWINAAIGIGLVLLTAAVIFGGVRRVATVAQGLVPLMAILYILLGVAVIVLNIEQVPRVLGDIFGHAFGLREFAAGGVGAAIAQGMRRGVFSSEAGLGSGPNAAATASVSHPAKQGLVQSLVVYFDTWLISSVTAFIVLINASSHDPGADQGVAVVQEALDASLGGWSLHALTLIMFLLAWTSVLGNYYYGEANLQFLDAEHRHMAYFRCAVLAAVLIGCLTPLVLLWGLANIALGVMAVVNLIALALLSPVAFRLLADYSRQLRYGLDPQFTLAKMPDLEHVTAWGPVHGHLPEDVDRSEGRAPGDPAAEADQRAWHAYSAEVERGEDGAEALNPEETPTATGTESPGDGERPDGTDDGGRGDGNEGNGTR